MFPLRGSLWGPRPLPEHLLAQLDAQGLTPSDAPTCVRKIAARPGAKAEASLFVDLGACKFLEGDIDGAIASWRHAISSTHDEPAARALLNLGLLYEHLGLHSTALGVLGAAADRGRGAQLAAAAMVTARCQQAAGDGDDAMETMARLAQTTMASQPDSQELSEVLFGLGEVAERAGRVDRAERAWRVASIGPESTVQQAATSGLIRLLIDQGHDDELPEFFGRVVTPDGQTGTAIAHAETLARLGDEESAAALLTSIPADDLAVSDRFRIAAVRLQIGLVNEAIDDFEILLGHDGAAVRDRAAFTLGEIYRTYEMSDAAASMYQRVIDDDGEYWSPRAMLSFGDVLHVSGDLDAARQHWAKAATAANGILRDRAQDRLRKLDTFTAPSTGVSDDVDGEELRESLDVPTVEDVADPEPLTVRLADLEQVDDVDRSADSGELSEPIVVVLAGLDDAEYGADSASGMSIAATGDDAEDSANSASGMSTATTLDSASGMSTATTRDSASGMSTATTRDSASGMSTVARPDAEVSNPYAALAPDGHESDVAPSTRNPYAELAPNFAPDDFTPAPDVQPGDWESMLEDGWPAEGTAAPKEDDRKTTSRAFSRYT